MARKKKKADASLDLVDQLISNEKKSEPKKRGRPKGSKNKAKKTVATPKVIAPVRVTKKSSAKTVIAQREYVTHEKFVELGYPQWGYTTAKIHQWKNKTAGYFEVLLDYHRAAILWSRLARTIDWYTSTSESHLSLCRREITAFREEHDLTVHDFNEVISISYNYGHKRKKMLKKLKELAKIVLENRRRNCETEAEKKAILFREVAKIPPNVRPALQFIKPSAESIEAEVRGAIADLTGDRQVLSEHACPDHINYRGLRRPRNGCPTCLYFYQYNKRNKVKEKRNR